MSNYDDFRPTRSDAYDYSMRSIERSRNFISHPRAAEVLGELAPRLLETLNHLYVPPTIYDEPADGVYIDKPHITGPRHVQLVSLHSGASVYVQNRPPFKPDIAQRRNMSDVLSAVPGMKVSDRFLDRIIERSNDDLDVIFEVFPDDSVGAKLSFHSTRIASSSAEKFEVRTTPLVTLIMRNQDEVQASPALLLNAVQQAEDIVEVPLINERRIGVRTNTARRNLIGNYVSATVLHLLRTYPTEFAAFGPVPHKIELRIDTIERLRSMTHGDLLAVDQFNPTESLIRRLKGNGIDITK